MGSESESHCFSQPKSSFQESDLANEVIPGSIKHKNKWAVSINQGINVVWKLQKT